jgi:hypothetical protein
VPSWLFLAVPLPRAVFQSIAHGRHRRPILRKPIEVLPGHALIADPDRKLSSSTDDELDVHARFILNQRRHTGSARIVVSHLAVTNSNVLHGCPQIPVWLIGARRFQSLSMAIRELCGFRPRLLADLSFRAKRNVATRPDGPENARADSALRLGSRGRPARFGILAADPRDRAHSSRLDADEGDLAFAWRERR